VSRRVGAGSWRGAAPALPALSVVLLVLGAGLGATLLQSLGLMPLVGAPRLSAAAYLQGHGDLLASAGLSLLIASVSTLLAALVGLTTALVLVGSRRGAKALSALATASIPVPHLVGAASLGLLLADTGLLARWLGLSPDVWPSLVAGRWPTAVVLEYAWKESAFVALVVSATLAVRLPPFHETAALLGAGRWARLRHVSLPLAAPSLLVASAIAFVYTLGAYEVAWLLGAAYPEPLPVMSYRLFTSTDLAARPGAMALAVTTAVLSGAIALGALALLRRTAAWR
jgi:putative spermidine/putrescine transport system permease protein